MGTLVTPVEPSATDALAAWVRLRWSDLPEHVVVVATQCILDTIGVAVAGAGEPAPRRLREVLDPGSEATLLGRPERAGHLSAALINGTAAHVLDYDDVSAPMLGHPSVPVLPAVLALGERLNSSLRDLLVAFVAGVEAEVRLATALGASHYASGFHTTATAGTVGAAVASAHLLRLNPAETRSAIGTAATQAAGLKAVFGSDGKALHAGKAAHSGLLSALLAQQGFTSAADVIAGPQGFAATHSSTWQPDPLHEPWGESWHVAGILFKFHAACYLTHASINGVLSLTQYLGDIAAVERLELHVPPGHLDVCAIDDPHNGLEAKFSLRFVAALAATRRAATDDLFTSEALSDGRIRQLMKRVVVVPDDRLSTFAARTVLVARGETTERHVDTSRRAWTHSPTEQWAPLEAKFRALTATALDHRQQQSTIDSLQDQVLGSVRQLAGYVRGASGDDPVGP
jgi:2-methylcitrate dehydratase PrpD